MNNFDIKYQEYLNFFENELNNYLSRLSKSAPKTLLDSISYAVTNGGKRIRPILMFAVGEILEVEKEKLIKYALAIEMIHSYSLVHDDLPSMDNDDYRRGKLSTHKKFGEAIGVLTGDALLNLALECILENENSLSLADFKAIKLLFGFSGYNGMIAGQVYDIEGVEDAEFNFDFLYKVYNNKTAKLLTAPLLIPSLLKNNKYYSELNRLGEVIGLLFQITDDVLDEEAEFNALGKTPGKDKKANKYTSVRLWGLDNSKKECEKLRNEAIKILNKIPNSGFLSKIIDKIYGRRN